MHRILIVEDMKVQRDALALILSKAGYETLTSANCRLGFKAAVDSRPDLILMDVNLPDGHGFDVCRRLKQDSQVNHIPVLLLTGACLSVEERLEGLEAGADDYVLKPFDNHELLLRIAGVLRAAGQRRR